MDTAVTTEPTSGAAPTGPPWPVEEWPASAPELIQAVAWRFDLDPDQVGVALRTARAATLARRAAQAPPPPVAPYYRLTWAEREVSSHTTIVTAAQLSETANPQDYSTPSGDFEPATSIPTLMARIARRPEEFDFDERVSDLPVDYRDRAIDDLERFDFEVEPLTVAEAFEERGVYRLSCWHCDARVERRGLRYVHTEQGTFSPPPPGVDAEHVAALLANHAPGATCLDGNVAEDYTAPYNAADIDELTAQWEAPPAAQP